jgi:octaprenyl-diphosphate synthase
MNEKTNPLSSTQEFKKRLCYTLVANIIVEMERELIEVKTVRFLHEFPWKQGKRLRPLIFLLSNLSIRAEKSASLQTSEREARLASAIELLHEASLIHDDIVDQSDLRRGAPTLHLSQGAGLSLLIGDYMIFQGMKLILDSADSADDIVLARELMDTGLNIAKGEAEQLDRYIKRNNPENRMALTTYIDIIAKKTAAFFAGCAEAGTALAKASYDTRALYRDFGMNLGLVFQMLDDLIDIMGDESVANKSLKNNINEGTITLPFIHAWQHFPENESLEKLSKCIALSMDEQHDLYHLLCSKEVMESCRETVKTYIEKTQNQLEQMPKNIYTLGLVDLFDYIKYCPWGGMSW